MSLSVLTDLVLDLYPDMEDAGEHDICTAVVSGWILCCCCYEATSVLCQEECLLQSHYMTVPAEQVTVLFESLPQVPLATSHGV